MHALRTLAAGLALGWLLAVAPAAAQPRPPLPQGLTEVTSVEGITEYRLANGLQLLLVPDAAKPTTTVNLTYRVGSRHENYGETGMAHLLEHLLFKGTPTHRNLLGEFSKRGLRANGTTWFDRTNYFASFSANDDNLRWYLGWLADAHGQQLHREERPRHRDDRGAQRDGARREQPRPRAAAADHGRDVHVAQLRQEHHRRAQRRRERRHPAPAGLLPPATTSPTTPRSSSAAASTPRRRWPGWCRPSARCPSRSACCRPPTRWTRRRTASAASRCAASAARRSCTWPTTCRPRPAPTTPRPSCWWRSWATRPPAGCTSGWSKASWRRRPSASASAWPSPGRCSWARRWRRGRTSTRRAPRCWRRWTRLATEPVTAEELQRAKHAVAQRLGAGLHRPRDAWACSSARPSRAVTGGCTSCSATRSQALTQADLQRVAAAYLRPDNRTVGVYLPTDQPQRAPAPARVDVAALVKDYRGDAAAAQAEAFEATPANLDARTQPQPPGQRPAGGAAAQGHTRRCGAGAAAAALRRRRQPARAWRA